jgi:hypothetical protein
MILDADRTSDCFVAIAPRNDSNAVGLWGSQVGTSTKVEYILTASCTENGSSASAYGNVSLKTWIPAFAGKEKKKLMGRASL